MVNAIFVKTREWMRAAALLAAATLATPAAAEVLLGDMNPPSWWAIGSPANCHSPHNFYSLELGNGFIRWQNGEGKLFPSLHMKNFCWAG